MFQKQWGLFALTAYSKSNTGLASPISFLLVCAVLFVGCGTTLGTSTSITPTATLAPTAQACRDVIVFDDPDPSLNATDTYFTCQGETFLILQPKADLTTAVLGYRKGDCGKMKLIELDFQANIWGVVFAKACPNGDVVVAFHVQGLKQPLIFLGYNSFGIIFDVPTSQQKFRGSFDGDTLNTYSIT